MSHPQPRPRISQPRISQPRISQPRISHLRAGGVSLLVDERGEGLPLVLHWGRDLGPVDDATLRSVADAQVPAVPSNSLDRPRRVGLLPQHADGYAGRATLTGSRPGAAWAPALRATGSTTSAEGGEQALTVEAEDGDAGLALRSELRLGPTGVLRMRHVLRNTGNDGYALLALPVVLPVPTQATQLLDLTGRHIKERVPQRMPLPMGAWVREQRRGRTGHDAPLLLAVGTPGFGFRHGEVWAVHVGWSGNATTFAERMVEGWAGIGGGELLEPEELLLAPGTAYSTPWLHAVYSDTGLDGVSRAHHGALRARPQHPRTQRPVVLNTWEAVYFDHDLTRLKQLADLGASLGIERFVLDDGWFGARRDDTAGLGDWQVSTQVWPDGLGPLVQHVTDLGMEFGLWVEPEMISPDSDLARAHPDWVLAPPGRTPPTARHQQVLDLGNPAAYDHVLSRLDALLTEYPISYLKWDHNRDLVDAASPGPDGRHRPGTHLQTTALYRLLDDLRARHPQLEIESCCGGGGRVDLGILQRTDRVWTSDCNDPLERQQIQRWTGLVVPPELMGAHVGPRRAHTTEREADLDFRSATAFFGHFGVEWDLTSITPDERGRLAAWITAHKRHRQLLHTGTTVRADPVDDAVQVHGVVSPDRREAIVAYVQLATGIAALPPPVRLPGLDPDLVYAVRPLVPGHAPVTVAGPQPPWWTGHDLTMPGSALADIGLPAPLLAPQQALLLHLTAAPQGAHGG